MDKLIKILRHGFYYMNRNKRPKCPECRSPSFYVVKAIPLTNGSPDIVYTLECLDCGCFYKVGDLKKDEQDILKNPYGLKFSYNTNTGCKIGEILWYYNIEMQLVDEKKFDMKVTLTPTSKEKNKLALIGSDIDVLIYLLHKEMYEEVK